MKKQIVIVAFFVLTSLIAGHIRAAEFIVDADGRKLTVARPFTRIISLYPAHTENLFSLGLDSEIVGVYTSDDYPAAAKNKPRFSYREDAEKILAARPDLVLVRPMISRGYADLIEKLKEAGIAVVSLQPLTVDQMFDYWLTLGVLTGRLAKAEAMVAEFRQQLTKIRRRVARIPETKRKQVYFESIHSKMKTFARNSMAIFALESAGGINVGRDADQVRNTNIAAYGKERILSHADEIDVFLAQTGRMNRVGVEAIREEPGFQALRAVRDNNIYLVDEKLVSRPTMRMLEGIRTVAGLLYPGIFSIRTAGVGEN